MGCYEKTCRLRPFLIVVMSIYCAIQTKVLCSLLLEQNLELMVERYKEEIGKPYSKKNI